MIFSLAAESFDGINLELYADSQKTFGGRYTTPVSEIRFSKREEKQNFGVLLTTNAICKPLPIEIKLGNISCSGSLSRLNNPELSSGTSPFSTGVITTTGLSASLPGFTSFSKEESSFLQIDFSRLTKRPLSFKINLWCSQENSSPVYSAIISDKLFSNQLTLSASCTTGAFYYDENTSSSWFLNSPYYKEGSHNCTLFQVTADYKNKSIKTGASTTLTAALYESPFGPYTAVYRTDLLYSYKQTDFYTSVFLNNYEDTITSSQKKLEPAVQAKTGILTKRPFVFKSEPVFIRFGANLYTKINLTKTEHPLRLNTGIQFTSEHNSTSFSVSGIGNITSSKNNPKPEHFLLTDISAQLKNSIYLKTLTPSLTLSAEKKIKAETKDDESDIWKYKINLNLTNNGNHKLNGSCSFSCTAKNKTITDKKLSASITGRLNFKPVIIIGKLTASFEL